MTDEQHQELVRTLLAYQGAVMLSGYRSALYDPLEATGWRRVDIPVTCSAVGRTRGTGLLGSGALKSKHRRTESVWLNPEAIARHAVPFEVLAARVIASKPHQPEEVETT